jgi:hypothetical protein
MARTDSGIVDVELSPEAQAFIVALASHAVAGALETLRAGSYAASEEHLGRVVKALRPREFAVAALVLGSDPNLSNEQLIEAARLEGARAVVVVFGRPPASALQ